MKFEKSLICWYSKNKRDLPWRQHSDPYVIWLSEIILQQTRVQQGLPYFLRFVNKYPTIYDLAASQTEEVLKLWQGLGYYSRGRNLHAAAQQIVNQHNGQFPDSFQGLLQLKGVGQYTAAAIASIGYGEPVAVVDGNVYRFLGRHFAVDTPINTTRAKKEFASLAESLMDRKNPGDFNQAMMEYGATVCTPKNPLCSSCVFNHSCLAYQTNQVANYPVKEKKKPSQAMYIDYFVVLKNNGFYMQQRPSSGIWGGLFEFPNIQSDAPITESERTQMASKLGLPDPCESQTSKNYRHILTHRNISARFHLFRPINFDPKPKHIFVEGARGLQKIAIPRLIDRYLNDSIFSGTNKVVT